MIKLNEYIPSSSFLFFKVKSDIIDSGVKLGIIISSIGSLDFDNKLAHSKSVPFVIFFLQYSLSFWII